MTEVKTNEENQKKGSNNKKFLLISLVVTLIANLIFSDPIKFTYYELRRYFQNGFQSKVLGYFFENLGIWLLISGGVFLGSFAIFKAISLQMKQEAENLEKETNKSIKISKDFTATKKIGDYVSFDDQNRKWATYNKYNLIEQVYGYDDIINFELLEDGGSVASGGLGRALVGGALFGGAGAIVGGVTGKKKTKGIAESLRLKVTVDDINNPVVYINFVDKKLEKNSSAFKDIAERAQECLSILQLICDKRTEGEIDSIPSSKTDEIMKYKELLDAGAITKEEYELKKKELLGL